MKDYKESIHILQTIHRNTQFTHLYSISGKIPHRITEKTLPILNAPIETLQTRPLNHLNQRWIIHSFLQQPSQQCINFLIGSRKKDAPPGCSTQRPPFYRRPLIGSPGVPWQMTGLHSSKGIDKGCIWSWMSLFSGFIVLSVCLWSILIWWHWNWMINGRGLIGLIVAQLRLLINIDQIRHSNAAMIAEYPCTGYRKLRYKTTDSSMVRRTRLESDPQQW